MIDSDTLSVPLTDPYRGHRSPYRVLLICRGLLFYGANPFPYPMGFALVPMELICLYTDEAIDITIAGLLLPI